jgi:anaerobic magnesium-protoporphyrin IX monomethyl ester cyclase
MNILLIFPPQAQPFLPHLALPSLKAFAESNSSHEISIIDANLISYEYFLSREFSGDRGEEFHRNIESALEILRCGEESYDPPRYYNALAIVQEGLKEVSRRYPGSSLDLKDFRLPYSASSSDQILKATRDYGQNPYLEFYERKILPLLSIEKPQLIGISIAWPTQLIPGFSLARVIKSHVPGIHLTIGGSMITHLQKTLAHKRKFFALCNSFLVGEGEIALLFLIEAIARGSATTKAPGLIFPEGRKNMAMNPPEIPTMLSSLPSPDFSGLPLERYFSPLPYLPLAASRGCYWNKCAFCSHSFSLSRYRPRHAGLVAEDMKKLHKSTGARHFYFVDDAVPPALLRALPSLLAGGAEKFHWGGEVRFDRALLSTDFSAARSAGCHFLLYGLESCCQRVLDSMNKGIDISIIRSILRKSHDAGIINWVFFFLGFPGESREEALGTLEFIMENREIIDMIAPGRFVLSRNSEIHGNQTRFGILKCEEPSMEFDLMTTFQYILKEGITSEEAMGILNSYRIRPEFQKFLRTFVAEVHLMFLRKSHFSEAQFFA